MSITPFGKPVVPLEYGSATRSSGSIVTRGGTPGIAASASNRKTSASTCPATAPGSSNITTCSTAVPAIACVQIGANNCDVNRTRAPESRSCFARSSFVYAGLAVVTTAPNRAIASTAITYSGELAAKIAQTSPFAIPSAARPTAVRSTSSGSAAYETLRPVTAQTSAGRSPRAAARASTNSASGVAGMSSGG